MARRFALQFRGRLGFRELPGFRQDSALAGQSAAEILQPAARKVGIAAPMGWHTFRHTYSSLLADNGNDVKVVQELMRHAKLSTTMEVYTHARMDKKRLAQRKAVDVLFGRQPELAQAAGN